MGCFNLYPQNSTFGLRSIAFRKGDFGRNNKHTFSLASISKDSLTCVIRHGFGKSLPRDHEDLSTTYLECKTMSMA